MFVIDIQKGKVICQINATHPNTAKALKMSEKKLEKLMNIITYLHYDETRHSIVSGHENGSIVIWN